MFSASKIGIGNDVYINSELCKTRPREGITSCKASNRKSRTEAPEDRRRSADDETTASVYDVVHSHGRQFVTKIKKNLQVNV